MAAKTKKQNFIAAYFTPFGLRQICDFLMLGGAVVLIVGLCLNNLVLTVGLGIYILASFIAVIRSLTVLLSKINKRSPEYKNAIVNIVIMGVILALSIFGFVWSIVA